MSEIKWYTAELIEEGRLVLYKDHDAALAKAQKEIEELKGQLNAVDMILARRSALDDIADRADKILHTIKTAKRAEKAEAEREAAVRTLKHISAMMMFTHEDGERAKEMAIEVLQSLPAKEA